MWSPILSASEASSCSSRSDPFGDKRRKRLTKSWLQSLSAGGPPGLFDHIYPLAYSDRTIESGGTATHLVRRPHTPTRRDRLRPIPVRFHRWVPLPGVLGGRRGTRCS